MLRQFVAILFLVCMAFPSSGQKLTQTIRGKAFDNDTQSPLPYVTIVLSDSNPLIGTTSDLNGNFILRNVPVGRQSIELKMLGYEKFIVNELMISSGNEVSLAIGLQKCNTKLDEVIVRVRKEMPLNSMATLSGRQFTVEETQRYAGGIDDPARLASSFAGVATPSLTSNGISVRGNNPNGLLWRIEGVEVPTPNHFANLTIAGGGLLTAISSQMMGNSDFYTGAFPAEYGNVSSGVFDIKLKNGSNTTRQHTFQAGLMGIDFATQGPFSKGKGASYIMNYRYSTMALLAPLLPDDTGILKYQDFSFKTNFPTKKAGIFTFWGLAALDGQEMDAADSIDWESHFDRDESETNLYMFASGLSHKIRLDSSIFINTTLAVSGDGLSHTEERLDFDLQPHPQSKAENNTWRYTFQMQVNKRFGGKHTHKTGFNYHYLGYNIDLEESVSEGTAPLPIAQKKGNSGLWQFYSQSKVQVSPHLTLNLGINTHYFGLNKNFSIEPRIGLKYNVNNNHSFALAYGLHSRIEQLSVYFVEQAGGSPNKELDLMKSAHYVFSYNAKLNKHVRLTVEPYYQRLTDVPVSPDSYISTLNTNDNVFFDEALVNKGTGRNIGVDFTLERFLHNGFYYLATASVFDAKYTAVDGIERNTRFNKNYVFNLLMGKEWEIGKNNMLSANVRLNYLGGNREEPIDELTSLQQKEVVYGETNGEFAFRDRFDDVPVFSVNISYRKNKRRYSSVWSLQVLNANSAQEFSLDFYNLKTGALDRKFEGIVLPNISYRIEF